jgi:hypothetical protein
MDGMRRSAFLVPLVVLPLVACSGSSGSKGSDLKERRAAYLKAAEAVCAKTNADVAALGTPTSVAAVPAFADKAVAIVQSTVDRFAAVQPPAEDRAEIAAKVADPLHKDVGVAQAYAAQVKAAANANDSAALLRLVQDRPQTSADLAFMRTYGFVQCVKAADQRG